MSLTDYDKIRQIIDDIIGVDTMQGNNLKEAVKNYFETKPNDIKLVTSVGSISEVEVCIKNEDWKEFMSKVKQFEEEN